MKHIILFTLMIVNLGSCFGQSHNDFRVTLDKFISKQKDKLKVTGVSVALMIDDEVILSKGYGYADKENHLLATDKTQYAVGSISKLATSTAVLRLYSENKIDIDKPYVHYVPEFSMNKHFQENAPFTVRHLLAHFAGIPRVHAKGYSMKQERPLSRILEISKKSYLIAPPGTVNQYSDWGTDLLAVLVEKVSGQGFEEYMEEAIFKPLAMHDSNYGFLQGTKSYNKSSLTPTYEYSYVGSDGLNSTAVDLMRLGQIYLNRGKSATKQFLNENIAYSALTPQFEDAPLNFSKGQGLMWDIRQFGQFTRISKGGIHEPFYSMLYIIPELHMSLAICSNSNSSGAIHWRIYGEVIQHLSKKKKDQGTGTTHPPIRPEELSVNEMNKLAGVYSTDEGIVNIEKKGRKFKITFEAMGKTFTGIPYSNNTIRIKARLLGFIPIHIMDIFWREVNKEIVVGEQYANGHRSLGGVKIKRKTIPAEWQQALGKYQATNLQHDEYAHLREIELKINKHQILEISGQVEYPRKFPLQLALLPLSENLAIVPGYSFEFFAGETIERFQRDGQNVILLSGYEFTQIK
ncbi:serine hydrolase domain-containing protein [Fulvivirgaceae bacterium BMA10]|uniref:Serine hydrolase domain-containing protein n=1 Tax=Splendidivirga corallicola TaxID=3051826 RepID=A0ABT8KMC1_9BACT|nr:serine hydrolase domain-containing protein [Fulvivirgaceae bacterium BMA10]